MNNIRSTNLRFNLNKELQSRAWEYLQTMDKRKFKSYSNAVAIAVVTYFEHYYKTQEDPYFETREREERFVNQIVCSVEAALVKTLPIFLAGCNAGRIQASTSQNLETQSELDPERDWDFLDG